MAVILDNFLGFYSIKTGAIFSGFFWLVFGWFALNTTTSISMWHAIYAVTPAHQNADFWIHFVLALYFAGLSISSVLTLIGVKKDKPRFLIAFLVYMVLNSLLILVGTIVDFAIDSFHPFTLCLELNGMALHVYTFLIVFAHYYQLRRFGASDGVQMVTRTPEA